MSKFTARLYQFSRALPRLCLKPFQKKKPENIKSVLVAHNLLLGDSVMLAPLLSKLRQRYPGAKIVLLCKKPFLSLLAKNPWGVQVYPYAPSDAQTVRQIVRSGPYDLAFVPGDNRYSWLALAAGARWIVGHREAKPTWRSWPLHQALPYPDLPMSWGDAMAAMAEGDAPASEPWLSDTPAPFVGKPYVVLHVGASNPTRFWPSEHWLEVAQWLEAQGYTPVWSGGASEQHLVHAADPDARFLSFAGKLSLDQLLALLEGAACLVCADTGVAHVAKLVNTPTITLYGPGNPIAFGPGAYWANNAIISAGFHVIPCRDQQTLFSRRVDWLHRCGRNEKTCLNFHNGYSACMQSIHPEEIKNAIRKLMEMRND